MEREPLETVLDKLSKLRPKMSDKQKRLLDSLAKDAETVMQGTIRDMDKGWANIEFHLRHLYRVMQSD